METFWPLSNLQVLTPTLTLRYITDELAVELAGLAAQGIHDPATMPFSIPWTDEPDLERNALQYFWRCRAEFTPEHWELPFAVIRDGVAIGVCTVSADQFPTRRVAETGSWLGRRHQGQGAGREMRSAALQLAFIGFGATEARTSAFHDNAASLAVTRSLPYRQIGASQRPRRGAADTMLEFSLARDQWSPRNDIQLIEIDRARHQLAIS
ncbi:GNAT family N-acetyltransferase [Mycobacterium sp. MAA66]|uniref:GNAT family N-acetyltransferase n=1 Tax=Mycobacterium sp. MAA66 TaxID=3156297 RepID=UPI003512C88C